ncbi:hypothetical protein [Actinoplanes xinjiangensis]|uniref:Uncharacterized protein n=1 Tax=Actinoplanes xinjiangensis TaxID=512350 RepID=A0A316F2T0_9ACTN|nr:hypothetical protein [Actinoplanes xinjiangensis]PWK39264.1 hypothetical protein BC793_123101 [Actinoplanes xinjiangensis]
MNALAPLRHTSFRFLLAGRSISALGNSFAPIALAFAVLDDRPSVRIWSPICGSAGRSSAPAPGSGRWWAASGC